MTIENLKQIAIKYATTKGSCVPLAPDELCNAVVQYFNEFLKITADINTIQVAVTEEGGNIVFTITGNTLDGKAFTPIVITVDHNDFVTNQEFEEFKTSVTKQLNNKRSVISSPASSYVVYTQANGLESNLPYSELANRTSTNIMARRANGTSDVKKGISGENVANMENIADLEEKIPDVTNLATKDELNNKLDKSNWNSTVYIVDSNAVQNNVAYTSNPSPNTFVYRDDNSNFVVNSPTENGNPTPKSYVDNALTNLADVTKENTFADVNHFTQYITSFGVEIGPGNADDDEYDVSIQESGIEIFHYISGSKANSLRITENKIMTIVYPSNEYNIFDFPNKSGTLALTSDIPTIPEYTSVDSVIYDTTNGAIIAYNGANEIHIPLLAGENVTIEASEDNKKIVISAAGGGGTGGGTGDVTAAGNNTFTGENTFNNSIYAKNGVVVGDTTNYGANSVTKGSNTYSFPNKSGTFAMSTDIIPDPIYFISFYANERSKACHLIGTMMSKNLYGTGQKTNEEFAVILADHGYTNSNEGLAAYGKLEGKDILCIYSEDGLSVRCLDEANSEVDLPTVIFCATETEL